MDKQLIEEANDLIEESSRLYLGIRAIISSVIAAAASFVAFDAIKADHASAIFSKVIDSYDALKSEVLNAVSDGNLIESSHTIDSFNNILKAMNPNGGYVIGDAVTDNVVTVLHNIDILKKTGPDFPAADKLAGNIKKLAEQHWDGNTYDMPSEVISGFAAMAIIFAFISILKFVNFKEVKAKVIVKIVKNFRGIKQNLRK